MNELNEKTIEYYMHILFPLFCYGNTGGSLLLFIAIHFSKLTVWSVSCYLHNYIHMDTDMYKWTVDIPNKVFVWDIIVIYM